MKKRLLSVFMACCVIFLETPLGWASGTALDAPPPDAAPEFSLALGDDASEETDALGTPDASEETDADEFATLQAVVIAGGTCGYPNSDDLLWMFREDGTLEFEGSGAMADYSSVVDNGAYRTTAPWAPYFDQVTRVIFPDGMTYIGKCAFYGYGKWAFQKITEVEIPSSVTSIGYYAFYCCSALEKLKLGGVQTISDYAFYNCSSLTEVSFSENLQTITYGAFYSCSSLTEVSLPESLQTLGSYAFYNCSSLTKVSILGNIQLFGYGVFEYCSALTEVFLSEGCQTIGPSAFYNDYSLTSVTVPKSVTSIENSAFAYCSALTKVSILGNVQSIGSSVFYNCTSLTEVSISGNVQTIGYSMFGRCASLTKVSISGNVQTIGNSAFYDCASLTSLTIPESVSSIVGDAFSGCSNLILKVYRGSYGRTYAMENALRHEVIDRFTLGDLNQDGSISIADYAMLVNLLSAEAEEFTAEQVRAANVDGSMDGDAPLLDARDLYLISKYITGSITDFPESPSTEQGEGAVRLSFDAYRMEKDALELTDSVNAGETFAVGLRASDLTPDLSRGWTCGFLIPFDSSFETEYDVTCLTPDLFTDAASGKQWVGVSGAADDGVVTCFYIQAGEQGLTKQRLTNFLNAFTVSPSDEMIAVQGKDGAVFHTRTLLLDSNQASYALTVDRKAEYPSGYCGAEGDNLTWVLTSDNTLTISGNGDMADYWEWEDDGQRAPWFDYAKSITNVVIENGVASIGRAAFLGFHGLKSLTIPNSVTTIGGFAFAQCGFKTLNIPDSVTSIGGAAFISSSLESVTIPDGVSTIQGATFQYCDYLKSITIPVSVTTIEGAFYRCGLSTVYYGGTRAQWEKITVDENDAVLNAAEIICAPDPVLTLIFDPMDGETSTDSKTVANGETYGELPAPVRAGYSFGGWYTEIRGGEQVSADTVANIEEDTVLWLYARWIPNTYAVFFDANGGEVSPQEKTVNYMDAYGELPTASRNKFIFDGWYTDASGGAQVHSDDVYDLSGNQTLYAHWTLDDKNAPKVLLGSVSGEAGERVSVPVTLENNPGIRSLLLSLSYNKDALTLVSVRDEGLLKGAAFGSDKTSLPYLLCWYGDLFSSNPSTADGTIATLVFQIKSGTQEGPYQIFMAVAGVTVRGLDQILFGVENGTVTVLPSAVYTVRFDANGGVMDGMTSKTVSVTNGQTVAEAPTPTRDGYDFVGWYPERDGGELYDFETPITANLTLYAHWRAADIPVHLDPNGGSVNPDALSIPPGGAYRNLPTPQRTNYKFLGWFTAQYGGQEILEGTPLTDTREHTLYAHWSIENVAVTVDFDYNGGVESVLYKNVTSGAPYGALPAATREDYVFVGWFTERDGGTNVKAETIVEIPSDHVLYARWSQPVVTIRFDLNGGFGSGLGKRDVQYGYPYGALQTKENVYWDEYHEFAGWFVKLPSGEERRVTETTKVFIAEDHILYARWEAKKVKVNLDPNGGTMGKVREFYVEYGAAYGDFLLENKATRDQYEFRGWWTNDVGGSQVTNLTALGNLEEHILYAHWRPLIQTVYFDGNDYGSVEKTVMYVRNGKTYGKLSAFTANDSAYELEGWFINPGEEDKGKQITSRTIVDLDSEQTLYAHVRLKDQFTVTFDLNGVEATVTPKSVTVKNGQTYGQSEGLNGALPVPMGANRPFLGWYTDRTLGRAVTSATVVDLGGNQTLYARWEVSGTYTVHLNPNADGASVTPDSVQVTNGKTYGELPVPVWENHVFAGWYTDPVNGVRTLPDTKVNLTAEQTLYAHWTEARTFDIEKDVYPFGNNAAAFEYSSKGPGESYPIAYEVFELIFGDTVAGKAQYRSVIQGLWGGNCNGMASAIALLFSNGGINPSDFGKADAVSLSIHDKSDKIGPLPGDLEPTVRTFIEALQIIQYTEPFAKAYKERRVYQYQLDDAGTLDELYKAVEDALNANKCTIIALGNSGQRAAHAVLAYRLENVSDTESRMYIYDCNYPNQERYVTLRKNADGHIKNWSYDIGGVYGVWETGAGSECFISYIPYDVIESIWENRGRLYGNHSMLTVNADNLSITTGLGSRTREVAKLVNGRLVTDNGEIYDVPNLSVSLSAQTLSQPAPISIYLPTNEYTISTDDDIELQASMVDYNLRAEVTTTSGSVTFGVEDLSLTNNVLINGVTEDDHFTVELESGYDGVKIQNVSASGAGVVGDISIFSDEGNYLTISGVPESNLSSLAINSVEIRKTDAYLSDEPYSVENVTLDKENGTVRATITNEDAVTIIAAIYDADPQGRFVAARTEQRPADAGEVTLDFSGTNFPEHCKVKVFLLDSGHKKLLARYDK